MAKMKNLTVTILVKPNRMKRDLAMRKEVMVLVSMKRVSMMVCRWTLGMMSHASLLLSLMVMTTHQWTTTNRSMEMWRCYLPSARMHCQYVTRTHIIFFHTQHCTSRPFSLRTTWHPPRHLTLCPKQEPPLMTAALHFVSKVHMPDPPALPNLLQVSHPISHLMPRLSLPQRRAVLEQPCTLRQNFMIS